MSRDDRRLSGWHPEDVKAAIRKKGETLTSLALRHDKSESYLRSTLIRPLFDGEQIIASFLQLAASRLWPSRYRVTKKSDPRRWEVLQRELRQAHAARSAA